ncbi:uroporphyrinogen-III C-methyltransferase [Glaciecola sp. 1036]|uniref:uroporphyrinogen-III C-methyltransferase n=1 Tax=Alteromonadaceae TaxID=72275 RepID=UPI003D08F55C
MSNSTPPENKDLSTKRRRSDEKDDLQVEEAVVIEEKASETAPEKPSSTPSSKPSSSNKVLWLFTVINFLLIAGVVGAGYWYWMQQQNKVTGEETAITEIRSQLSAVERKSNAQDEDLQSAQNAFSNSLENLVAELQNNAQTTKALQQHLAEISGRRPSDWLLAEADYLVNMAGRKLYLEHDIRTAKTLLQEADARLEDLNDPTLYPVRTLIASDLAALNQINTVSVTSIALAVNGLVPQVQSLPMRTFRLPESSQEEDTQLSSDVSDWQENLKRTWRSIVGDFISIKHVDAPIEPYLAERQQWLIQQQLKYALSRAQSAALSEQVTLFQQNIQEAMAIVTEHYELDNPATTQYLGALEQLLNTDFSREYPENLQSQKGLKELLQIRMEDQFNNGNNSL